MIMYKHLFIIVLGPMEVTTFFFNCVYIFVFLCGYVYMCAGTLEAKGILGLLGLES